MSNKHPTNRISGNYKILKVLGQGCYGHVVECLKRDTVETVAVKVLKQRNSQHDNMREISLLERLSCLDPDKSNIVRCLEWFYRRDRTFIVFEKLDISLYEYMSQREWVPMPADGIRIIISDVATALSALKGLGLIHTDLKLDNILLVDHQTQPFRVKVIDFGLCLETSEASPHQCVQPLCHRSPEIILGLSFTESIDIWSLGLVMSELLLGFSLFPGTHEYDTLRFIVDLLGDPPKRLLNGGIHTGLFYHGSRKHLIFLRWTLMTPMEFEAETGIESLDDRSYQFSSLDELKTFSSLQRNSADAADRNTCVELLKKMLQMDPRNRITPNNILAHPFITRSAGNSCLNEALASETSWSQTSSDKDTSETNVDLRWPIQLPSGVIMVLPAENTTQSPQAVQNNMTNPPLAEDDRGHILGPVNDISYDSGLALDSIIDRVKVSSSVDRDSVEAPGSSSRTKSSHVIEVCDPKRKAKKKGYILMRSFFCCFIVSEDNDE